MKSTARVGILQILTEYCMRKNARRRLRGLLAACPRPQPPTTHRTGREGLEGGTQVHI